MKQNCWEFKKCGRELGGKSVRELGICPAVTDERLHDVHKGKNGGRACWVLAGTFCGGKIQGTFAQKFSNCEACDFFKTVKREENGTYQMSIVLLNKLKALG
ncbi:MAG TPA: hypothetical protein VN328_09560 [Thermodesulfovibrionales bacterium]|nr:hypothetical protein [Thermodesulfovibrionales bacterium]